MCRGRPLVARLGSPSGGAGAQRLRGAYTNLSVICFANATSPDSGEASRCGENGPMRASAPTILSKSAGILYPLFYPQGTVDCGNDFC